MIVSEMLDISFAADIVILPFS